MDENSINQIAEKIKKHHTIYRFPVKGEMWEDIFDSVINGDISTWVPGGHDVGTDVVDIKNNIRYQNKSGIINFNDNSIKWSGHRTTSYKTINEKIDFIDKSHCDKYVMLGRNKAEWDTGNINYYLLVFDSSLINYSSLTWREKYSNRGTITGWEGAGNENFCANIYKSMSDQLWTQSKIGYLGNLIKIQIRR